MKYVLDSSVAFKWVVVEAEADKAIRMREDIRKGIHQVLAPDIFPVEIGHALTKAERQGRVTAAHGWSLWLTVMGDAPVLHPSVPLMPRAYAIASAARIGIYDCLYVALAEREGCELVTADARLVVNLQAQFPFIRPLAAFP